MNISRLMATLKIEFQSHAYEVLKDCNDARMPMQPFCARRTPRKQARLWRQSRSTREIRIGIEWLRSAGAPWLAELIEDVGPQYGPWATNAAPGNSWHQWGLALDCVAVVGGSFSWDTVRGERGGPGDAYYRFYAECAAARGLTPLGPTLGDWVHMQQGSEGAPSDVYGWPKIDEMMRETFSTSHMTGLGNRASEATLKKLSREERYERARYLLGTSRRPDVLSNARV